MKTNPYVKTEWEDEIYDPIADEVIEEGTKITAERMNNIEDGIHGAYEKVKDHDEDIQKLRVQIDMVSRAPVNNGTFYDTIDGETKSMTRDTDSAIAQTALSMGATTITLNAVPFVAGEHVVIYDDTAQEVVKVSAVTTNSITVGALANNYKKGAVVARSNVKVNSAGDKMMIGDWGTYTITMQEVV